MDTSLSCAQCATRSCGNSPTHTSYCCALTNVEHHTAPASQEGENLSVWSWSSSDPTSISDFKRIRNLCLLHLSGQHKIRGSLWHVHFKGHFCCCLMMGALTDAICLPTHPRAVQQTLLKAGAGEMGLGPPTACSPRAAQHVYSFTLPALASSPHTAQALHRCPFPPAYLIAQDAAWPQQHWGASFPYPVLPPYSPLLTAPRLAAALHFCLSSTGEASEETCECSPGRLLLHLALSSGRRYPMNRSGKAKGAQRVLSSGFEQAAAHSWI